VGEKIWAQQQSALFKGAQRRGAVRGGGLAHARQRRRKSGGGGGPPARHVEEGLAVGTGPKPAEAFGTRPVCHAGGVGRGGERKEGAPGAWAVMGRQAWAGPKEQ
jgi:hypothetical protein